MSDEAVVSASAPESALPVAEAQPEGAKGASAPPALGSLAVLAAAIGVFALIARRVATKSAEPTDQATRDWIQEHRNAALDVAVKPVTMLSVPMLVVAATGALVLWLHRTGRGDAAIAVAIAPVMAATAGQSFTTFLAQRNPPDAGDSPHGEVTEPSFPSGHTTGVTAEALGIAYILSREGLAKPAMLAALMAWPMLVGTSRVYRDRHWITDVIGGWVAGAGVAAISAMVYDGLAARSAPESPAG